MLGLTASIVSARASFEGWRYFWGKRVNAFDPNVHCARCLVGSYVKPIGVRMPVNEEIGLPGFVENDILYVCGVSAPYRWANNLHLAVRVTGDRNDRATMQAYNGDLLVITGAIAIPFDDAAAKADHPHRGKDYLTCRNFQFGASLARAGLLRSGRPQATWVKDEEKQHAAAKG